MQAALLDEISSESLQHLLSSVRFESMYFYHRLKHLSPSSFPASPLGSTHIPALDAHCFATARHHPSPGSSLNLGDVIEIQGPPTSGKTHLLYHLLATCLAPCDLHGWDKSAVLLDTDGSFDISRLKQLLAMRLSSVASGHPGFYSSEEVNHLVIRCLKNLHIFRVSSSAQLAATLVHLPQYHAAHLPDSEIGLLAIDSISTYYWCDRFTAENHRSAPATAPSAANPLQHVLVALQNLRASHMPVIVLINWGLSPLAKHPVPKSGSAVYRQHLYPFLNFPDTAQDSSAPLPAASFHISHHITMSVLRTPLSFADSLEQRTLSDRLNIRSTKWPEKAEFVGMVRTSGSPRVGRFVLQIGRDAYTVTD